MKKYTVFIRQPDNTGTTFISSAEAETEEEAIAAVLEECRDCWDWEGDDLHVLGVAAGDIEILEWDDLI